MITFPRIKMKNQIKLKWCISSQQECITIPLLFKEIIFSSYIVLQLGKQKNIIECKHIYLMTAVH